MAAELSSINYRETAITLTPSDSGRFEVYLDGKKLYDRRETIKTREAGREVERAIKDRK